MLMAYKGFSRDLSCTSGGNRFQYRKGIWNEEPEANTGKNGFHCAEDPLDCLNYYPDREKAVYYLVLADGDVNEDGYDSKISCTRMKLVKELGLKDFLMHALRYLYLHPYRKPNRRVKRESAAAADGFAIVRGKGPIAKGKKGDILAFVKEEPDRRDIEELGLYEVDGIEIKEDRWYDISGREADACGKETAPEA